MKRRWRRRRVAKWACTLLCLVVLAALGYSVRYTAFFSPQDRCYAWLGQGALTFLWEPDPRWRFVPPRGWQFGRSGGPMLWEPQVTRAPCGFILPLWLPLLLFGVPAAVLWYCDPPATRETIHDWAVWLHPRRPKRVTWRLTTALGLLHALAAVVAVKALLAAPDLLFPLRPGAVSSLRELRDGWIVACLVWSTPIWAMLWARVYVRVMNSAMLDAYLGRYIGHCRNCGYDLTGNVSGVCPECGTPVADARTPKASG